jgi:proteic killer suppression protein
MRIRFEDHDLQRLHEEHDFALPRFGPEVTRAFRKKVAFLEEAESETDLRNYKALHFEKLRGGRAGQHSIRLNRQWRLILRIESDAEGRLLIVVEVANHY